MHWISGDIVLSKKLLKDFFKKRTSEENIYKIFGRVYGDVKFLEDRKYSKCTITFHFSNHVDTEGEITRELEYKPTGGRNIVSYMKTMLDYLVEEREMIDGGHFCIVVEE